MPKIKKSDLRYGDVIKFETPISFGTTEHFLHGRLQGFQEDTFLVDVLPPVRGKKTPEVELRSASQPEKRCNVKGAWPKFEVVSRLPDDVQVFKVRTKNFGGPVHFRNMIIGRDGTTWDDKAVTARRAMEAARTLGCAAVVIRSFGYAEVYPFSEGVPSYEFLKENVNDPWETITGVYGHSLDGGPYLVYGGDNAWNVESPVLNEVAQFALLDDPELREIPGYAESPLKERGLVPGNVVILVGFSICNQTGDTIRTPIQQNEVAA